jgi:YggT family protein
MLELLGYISLLLSLYIWVLIAAAVMSWLIAFNVVNTRNPAVGMIERVLWQLTEPVLRPVRNILPPMSGIDFSPIVVVLVIWFIQGVILPNIAHMIIGR